MDNNKKARREKAVKKAKQKKTIITAICISGAVVFAALLIVSLLQSGNGGGVVDLTRMSKTMVAAEMTKISNRPNNYIERTIKANGNYNTVYNAELKREQHFITVVEPDTCCPKREFEFIWDGDYPQTGARIEITGVFGSYKENGKTYYYLEADDVIVLGYYS